ncbi:unnamed protein product, partial [Iphiclides podalirius]
MRFNRTVCRNDGNFAITCCHQEYATYTLDRDRNPPRCPPLPRPEIEREMDFTPHLQVIWEACLNYSMEGSRCIRSPESPDHYERDQCLDEQTGTKVADGVPANLKQFPHMVSPHFRAQRTTEPMASDFGLAAVRVRSVLRCSQTVMGYIVVGKHVVPISTAPVRRRKYGGRRRCVREYRDLTEDQREVEVFCVSSGDGPIRYALLGATNKTDLRSGLLYHVARLMPHLSYKFRYKPNDIALVELSRRVSFTEFIRPLCLKVPGL